MVFAPEPENDFTEFIDTYFEECRRRIPRIEAIAGKWRFEDLIPGMSDFDTRFICSDGMEAEDWCRMSDAVGEAHLELCGKRPEWSRKLEHLPGINLTWSELSDDSSYYPEYNQWTFYRSVNKEALVKAQSILDSHPWDSRDEFFHLKKFMMYFYPYDRSIDPAINLGAYENKYPLHSRIMHYFNPPVQSAASVMLKRNVKGKKEAFRLAKEVFRDAAVFEEAERIIGEHYETEELYAEPALSDLENRLYECLVMVFGQIKKHVGIIDCDGLSEEEIRSEIKGTKMSPGLVIFDSCKFCRLMKGRLRFYANTPPYFDNIWAIQNELKRIRTSFYKIPFITFWKMVSGEEVSDPDEIISKLVPDYITKSEMEAAIEFSRLAPGTWEKGKEAETALNIADIFDEFFTGLYRILGYVRREG